VTRLTTPCRVPRAMGESDVRETRPITRSLGEDSAM
jgi:hypothetical protein